MSPAMSPVLSGVTSKNATAAEIASGIAEISARV